VLYRHEAPVGAQFGINDALEQHDNQWFSSYRGSVRRVDEDTIEALPPLVAQALDDDLGFGVEQLKAIYFPISEQFFEQFEALPIGFSGNHAGAATARLQRHLTRAGTQIEECRRAQIGAQHVKEGPLQARGRHPDISVTTAERYDPSLQRARYNAHAAGAL